METPGDRIARELERLPHRKRMEVVAKVLRRMGMIKPVRLGFLSKNATTLAAVAATVVGVVAGSIFWTTGHPRGQQEVTKVEGSADTGFEITSDPPGVPVWVDGEELLGNAGLRSNVRVVRISPGRHVLELKGGPGGGWYWRQAIFVEPGQIKKFHAEMVRLPAGSL